MLAALLAGVSLHALGASLHAEEPWGPWPDLRFVPEPSQGWSLDRLDQHWAPVVGEEPGEDGVFLRIRQGTPRTLRVGEPLGLYQRSFDGSIQGLVGRAEVISSDRDARDALVRVDCENLVEYFEHDPWQGWQRRHQWRSGFSPAEIRYYVSPENLVVAPEENWTALLERRVERGTSARDVLRTLGSPAARGAFDFATGRQEQWVYSRDPWRRTYVYLDVATQRVTALHQGR